MALIDPNALYQYGALTRPYNPAALPAGAMLGGPLGGGEYQSPDTSMALLQYLLQTPAAPGLAGPSPSMIAQMQNPAYRFNPFTPPATPYPTAPQQPLYATAPPVGISAGRRPTLLSGTGQPVMTATGPAYTSDIGGLLGNGPPPGAAPAVAASVPPAGVPAGAPQSGLLFQDATAPADAPTASAMPGGSGVAAPTWDQVNSLLTNPGLTGLLSGSLKLLAQSGWSPRPISTGEGLGVAGQQGLDTATSQEERNRRYQLLNEQAQSLRAMREAQIATTQQQIESRARTNALLNELGQAQQVGDQGRVNAVMAQLFPEKVLESQLKSQEPFTLGADQSRYGPDGKPIASGPGKWELKPIANGDKETQMWVNDQTHQVLPVQGAGARPIFNETPLVKFEVNMAEKWGSAAITKLQASDAAAEKAVEQKPTIDRLKSVLNDPATIAGVGAETRLKGAQVLNLFAGGSANEEQLAKTRDLIQGLSELTLQSRGLMKGQGQISDREQALLQKARGGDFTMTVPELKALVDVFDRASKAQYDLHVRNYSKAKNMTGAQEGGVGMFEPPANPWASQDQSSSDISPGAPSGPWQRFQR